MNKPKTENLTAWVTGRNLNVFQKADAVIEYNKLLDYVSKLEEAITVTHCCKSDSEQLFKDDPHECLYYSQGYDRCKSQCERCKNL